MTAEATATKAAARATSELRKAIAEAKAAYEFAPNSYTYSCLGACLAAEVALGVLLESLSDIEGSTA